MYIESSVNFLSVVIVFNYDLAMILSGLHVQNIHEFVENIADMPFYVKINFCQEIILFYHLFTDFCILLINFVTIIYLFAV